MKKYKNDFILFVVILLVGLVAFTVVKLTADKGAIVTVTIDGEEYAQYDLKTESVIVLGDKTNSNTLNIKDGCAFLSDATCPDKLCVAQGKISFCGETIVCLPNKTIITVKSNVLPQTDFVQ